jgi:hypothetical protein
LGARQTPRKSPQEQLLVPGESWDSPLEHQLPQPKASCAQLSLEKFSLLLTSLINQPVEIAEKIRANFPRNIDIVPFGSVDYLVVTLWNLLKSINTTNHRKNEPP